MNSKRNPRGVTSLALTSAQGCVRGTAGGPLGTAQRGLSAWRLAHLNLFISYHNLRREGHTGIDSFEDMEVSSVKELDQGEREGSGGAGAYAGHLLRMGTPKTMADNPVRTGFNKAAQYRQVPHYVFSSIGLSC